MRNKLLVLGVFLAGALVSFAEKPPSADKILSEARAKAKSEQKSVLVVFGASWCPDCEVLDTFLNVAEAKTIFDRYFVVVHLNVFEEAGEHPKANTPGSEKVIAKYGGISSIGEVSLPYMVILNPEGKDIIDGHRPAAGKRENIGFPSEKEDLQWFLQMLKTGAPALTQEEAKRIFAMLNQQAD
jgi:thioredoxin-related protein